MHCETAAGMVAAAKQSIRNLTVADLEREAPGTLLVDIREAEERAAGTIPGSIHAPRGMLEFYADPTSPYHRPEFDQERRIVLFCASGGRSALATETLQRMGYVNIAHLDGGVKAWQAAATAPVGAGS